MCPLLKLQPFDGTGNLDTFLLKFRRMASYLCWDEEDALNHLCGSLEGAVGQVFWDIGPRDGCRHHPHKVWDAASGGAFQSVVTSKAKSSR